MDTLIIVALCLSVVGNIINAWGMIIMKMGHEKANAKRMRRALDRYLEMCAAEAEGRPIDGDAGMRTKSVQSAALSSAFLREPKWWVGMVIYISGSLMHVGALGFGPSALLNPMGGLTLVANVLSSPIMLGETLTKVDIIGTCVIVVGITLVILFGPHSEESNTMDELLDRFDRHAFLVWTGCIWSITFGCWLVSIYIEGTNKRDQVQMDGSLKPRGAVFLALTYTNIKGVMGGFTMLFSKIAMEAMDGGNFERWETYFFILVFVGFNFGMEYWRQKALSLFSTMYVVPLMQVSLVVLSVISGGIFFSEFDSMDTVQLVIFGTGVAIICSGVAILSAVTEGRKLRQVKPFTKLKAACIAIWSIFALRSLVKKRKGQIEGVGCAYAKPSVSMSESRRLHEMELAVRGTYSPVVVDNSSVPHNDLEQQMEDKGMGAFSAGTGSRRSIVTGSAGKIGFSEGKEAAVSPVNYAGSYPFSASTPVFSSGGGGKGSRMDFDEIVPRALLMNGVVNEPPNVQDALPPQCGPLDLEGINAPARPRSGHLPPLDVHHVRDLDDNPEQEGQDEEAFSSVSDVGL